MNKEDRSLLGIPRPVWALGFVSMFMDLSSEMIHGLLPVFIVSVLGASAMVVGWIEGVSEAATLIIKAFSGAMSDRLGKRKPLVLTGYGVAAVSKPLFALANSVGLVFAARFLDRIGKGIRGAPRDALIADVVGRKIHGAAFGLRQSLDTVGAVLGPVMAIVLMNITAGDFRFVFWIAVIPALISVVILLFGVREPRAEVTAQSGPKFTLSEIRNLGTFFWFVVAVGTVFTLARFSEAFLMLRALSVGVSMANVPMMLLIMSLMYAATAYPAGQLSDRIGRQGLLVVGLVVLIGADLVLALADSIWQVAAGSALWGLHMGLTQGLFAALVADAARPNLRGTAFGVFSFASGLGTLVASVLAGWIWDHYGASVTFFTGAVFAAVAAIGFLVLRKSQKSIG